MGAGEVWSLFSRMSSQQVLGMVEDQSGNYLFLTGATALPRQVATTISHEPKLTFSQTNHLVALTTPRVTTLGWCCTTWPG